MVLSQAHAEEIFWLKRRMQFVFEYDALTKRQAPIEELMALAEEFRKVETPSDLVERLKDLYGDGLRGFHDRS